MVEIENDNNLIECWNTINSMTTSTKKILNSLYLQYGYGAARLAILAVANTPPLCTYIIENISKSIKSIPRMTNGEAEIARILEIMEIDFETQKCFIFLLNIRVNNIITP